MPNPLAPSPLIPHIRKLSKMARDSPPSKHTHPPQKPKNQSQQEEEQEAERTQQNHHLCDFCNESIPLLHCRADSAKLCFACDRKIHSDNPLFSKHQRNLLCNACGSNPSSIFCSTHNFFLCQNCDWEVHDRLSEAHDRRPLEGFSGCPSALEFASGFGFDEKGLLDGEDGEDWIDGVLDAWVWETTAPVVSIDDLIVPTTAVASSDHGFQALGLSPPMKHRNVACGKCKEEIMQQLRDLVKTETHLNDDSGEPDAVHALQFSVPEQTILPQNLSTEYDSDAVPILVPSCEASAVQWHGNSCEATDQASFSYKNVLEDTTEESSFVLQGYTNVHGSGNHNNDDKKELPPCFEEIPRLRPRTYELAGHDRDMVISRYKEKKKTRRYDKHIRYESRKARADSRTRIKGRFAKVTQDEKVDSVERKVWRVECGNP